MPGRFGILLDSHFLARDPGAKTLFDLRLRSEIFGNCNPNVFQCLFARCALAVAARKVIAPNRKALFGFYKRDVIGHCPKVQYMENLLKTFFSVEALSQRCTPSAVRDRRYSVVPGGGDPGGTEARP